MASAQNEVMKTFFGTLKNSTLTGREALDEAIRACSNFTSYENLLENFLADAYSVNGDKSKFIKEYCGINIFNSDVGAITGSDAGGSTTKTIDSIVPESGDASYPDSTTFTICGMTFEVPEKTSLSSAEQIVVQGLYSWWLEESIKLVEESGSKIYRTDRDGAVVFTTDGVNIKIETNQ